MPVEGSGVLYLLPVLLASTRWGLWLGVATAIASAAAFNYFHIPPTGRFTIAEEENWVALGAFLVVAVVTSGLADSARSRAEDAERRRREADLTAEMARVLLGGSDLEDSMRVVGQRIARAFDLPSVELTSGWRDSDDAGEGTADHRRRGPRRDRRRAADDAGRGGRGDRAAGDSEPRDAAERRARAREPRGAGDRDPSAATLERGQDRAVALGLSRPALAADRDHRRGRRPRLADPRLRRTRRAGLGDRRPRPSASPAWSTTCSTCRGSSRARSSRGPT